MTEVEDWVCQLASDQAQVRERSREYLVHEHSPDVTRELIGALSDPRTHVRWEAAKTLNEIADPAAAPALVQALEDESEDVRWLAAEGLVAMQRPGLLAVLELLTRGARSMAIRTSAHHVLRMNRSVTEVVGPVIRSLEQLDPAVMTPLTAFRALIALSPRGSNSSLDSIARL